MAELKQMPFGVISDDQGRIVSLHSVLTSVTQEKHDATLTIGADGYASVQCSCGARWSMSPSRQTEEEIKGTFNSHLSYYSKPKLTTL